MISPTVTHIHITSSLTLTSPPLVLERNVLFCPRVDAILWRDINWKRHTIDKVVQSGTLLTLMEDSVRFQHSWHFLIPLGQGFFFSGFNQHVSWSKLEPHQRCWCPAGSCGSTGCCKTHIYIVGRFVRNTFCFSWNISCPEELENTQR